MTSASLSLWIALGIVLQLAVYLGIGFWRHWRNYQSLRGRAIGLEGPEDPATDEAVTALWPGFRRFRVARKVFEDTAQSICSFYLVPEDQKPLPPFLPGQFLTFRLDIANANGQAGQIVRCYSLSDAPGPDSYRITIKRARAPADKALLPGLASSYFHDHIAEGDLVQARAPAGHFHIDHSDVPVVLIGSGIGITPMLSMLNWSLKQQNAREIWLFYGVRHGRELIMRQHLEALTAKHPNFHLHLCFSDPQADELAGRDFQHRGHIALGLLRMQLPIKPYHFYICGPSAMMESLVPALEDWGVPEARIHFEAFGPASIRRNPGHVAAPSAPDDATVVVNFSRSGKQLTWLHSNGNLLELAEANGVSVNSGCRSGSCGSCQTVIKSGEVGYRQPPDFDPEPGTCLLCVCTPKTSLTLEA